MVAYLQAAGAALPVATPAPPTTSAPAMSRGWTSPEGASGGSGGGGGSSGGDGGGGGMWGAQEAAASGSAAVDGAGVEGQRVLPPGHCSIDAGTCSVDLLDELGDGPAEAAAVVGGDGAEVVGSGAPAGEGVVVPAAGGIVVAPSAGVSGASSGREGSPGAAGPQQQARAQQQR